MKANRSRLKSQMKNFVVRDEMVQPILQSNRSFGKTGECNRMKPTKHLLSFVTNDDGTVVTIHADRNGVHCLIKELELIRDRLDEDQCEHCHLFSDPDIAGDALSASKMTGQESEQNIVHAVKIYGWNAEWAVRNRLFDPPKE
jgi:hypothetical protein